MKICQPAAVAVALTALTLALACSLLPAPPAAQPTLDVRVIVRTSVAQNAATNTAPTATTAPTILVPLIMPATATAEPTTTTAPTAPLPSATPLPTVADIEDPLAKLLFSHGKTPAVTPTVKPPTVAALTLIPTAPPEPPPPTATATPEPPPPTATATPEPPPPTATASPSNQALITEHADAKRYMLQLINAEREKAGVPAVTMGENPVAQLQAEASNEHCFISHWDTNGLKPYLRYALTGGYQDNGENAYARQSCYGETAGRHIQWDLESEIKTAMKQWMSSDGHRRTMLGKNYRKVNIGIAYGAAGINMYQHFEGDYVQFTRPPSITGTTLQMAGTTRNGSLLQGTNDLLITVNYDPPPSKLTLGQLLRTNCYSLGDRIAALRPPPERGYFYYESTFPTRSSPCPDPYLMPDDVPNADSIAEAQRIGEAVDQKVKTASRPIITGQWITAQHWEVANNAFNIAADIGGLLAEHGAGVYTIGLHGRVAGGFTDIALYSIFHRTTPPDLWGGR